MNRSEFVKALIALLAMAWASGCGFRNDKVGDPGVGTIGSGNATPNPAVSTAPGSPATFAAVNQGILRPMCISCHGRGNSPDLSSYSGFATNTAYVAPGNPAASAIYTATRSGAMPAGGPPLSPQQLQLLYDWIQQGAQDN